MLSCVYDGAYKRTLAINVAAVGFLSRYLNGPLPYVRRYITVNKNVLNVSLNKTFPFFTICPTPYNCK